MSVITDRISEKLKSIPELPGIYKFYNADGMIIYIGKSKCLKKRVKSYFAKTPKWEKVKKLVCFIHDIEYIVTDTHLEARLLECELIKTVKPHFNSQMKNDQRYVYLKVADYSPLPYRDNPLRVTSEREEETFGPFRSRYTLIDIIDSFRNLYPIIKTVEDYSFDYHLLPVSLNKASFTDNRNSLMDMFTDVNKLDLFSYKLEEKMKEAASLYKYETASFYRDILSGFQYIKHGINAYQNLISRDILLRIPYPEGLKLFYVSGGLICLKEKYSAPTKKDINKFIRKGQASALPGKTESGSVPGIELTDKMRIDFRDVLYSEIMALPEEMVEIL